jgi:hypothetical protein
MTNNKRRFLVYHPTPTESVVECSKVAIRRLIHEFGDLPIVLTWEHINTLDRLTDETGDVTFVNLLAAITHSEFGITLVTMKTEKD